MRKMRDSGIEWVGAIPQDWQLSKIGSLYTQRNEKVSDKDYQPLSVTMQGILPQLATAAKTDDGDNRKLVRVGDFAINSRSDRRGSCGISPLDGSVSLINIILTPRTAMHPGYYNWLFHTTLFADEFYKWGHGIVADLWTTRWQEMKSITVPVPEYAEQERIAAFLDAECAEIDTVLEKTRASIEEYKKLKQAVITQAVTKGIRGDRPMKDSGIEWIGDIPAEWRKTQLRHCAAIKSGITLGKKYEKTDSLVERPYLRVANVQDGYVDLSVLTTIEVTQDEDLKYRLRAGDVLMTEGGDRDKLGRGCVWHGEIEPCLHQNHIFAVQTSKDTLLPEFLEYLTVSDVGRSYFDVTAIKTTNLACTSSSKVLAFTIPLPSVEEQAEIVEALNTKCAGIDALVAKKQQYLTEIENYKKSLIYEYVTGKKEMHPL
mgnify:CR=1 FL=1